MRVPAYGLNDAPVAFHSAVRRYLSNPVDFSAREGLKFQVSLMYPCLFFAPRKNGGARGATTSYNDEIIGLGEPDVSSKARGFANRRSGTLKVQEKSSVLMRVEFFAAKDFPVQLT